MSSHPQNRIPRSWKQQAGAGDGPAGQPWRTEAEPVKERSTRRSRGMRLLAAFFVFLLFSGGLIFVSLWLQPARGTSVVILYAGYEEDLAVPHNVAGRKGAEALGQLAASQPRSSGGLQQRVKERLFDRETWSKDLAHVKEKTLLLCFAVHGGADGHGAYLLPPAALAPKSAELIDPKKDYLRMEEVLDRLSDLTNKSALRSRNIVVVLDCTQMAASSQLGMLHNNFVHELAKLDGKMREIPNLVVLCASGEDQRSWASEDVNQTIFSHFLVEGLKGAADGVASEGQRDGRINAYELHKYVSDNVALWVRLNRAAEQTPTLWPKQDNVGEQRAKAIHLTVVPKDYVVPPPQTGLVFAPPDVLKAAWKKRDALAANSPAPAVYAPHLWRSYVDTLVRYEELLQVGETRSSSALANKLKDAEQALLASQKLDLDSLGNTLAMPAVTQPWGPADKDAAKALNRLWEAPPANLAKEWAAVQKQGGADKNAAELLRLRLCELALERFSESPAANLEKANRLLHELDSPLQPRAAESHFLVMLHRDLPRTDAGNFNAPLLKDVFLQSAVDVRLRAERAALGLEDNHVKPLAGTYAYAEQVVPWIRDTVAEADKLRRAGQDHLFGGGSAQWDAGQELLQKAKKLYQQAQIDAVRVRLACMVRDRVQPELGYYGNWLAARVLAADEVKPVKEGALRKQVLELWPEVHELGEQLDRGAFEGLFGGEKDKKRASALENLSPLAARVQRKFAAVQQGYQDFCKQLDAADPVAEWHNIDDALLVPALDLDSTQRMHLLAKRSRVSRDLFHATLQMTAKDGAPLDAKAAAERVQQAAIAQGRLTLAALGKRWIDDAGDKRETFEQLQKRLDNVKVESYWQKSVTTAGSELGFRWRQLPVEIAARMAAAKKADAAGNLRTSDRLVRLLDGAATLQIGANPAVAYRKRLVQELLLWQVHRTVLDHWAAEDPSAEPYFRVAGQKFFKDARDLDKNHEMLARTLQELNLDWKFDVSLVKAPGWRPGGSSVPLVQWTSEEDFPLQFRVTSQSEGEGTAAGAGLEGSPVLWFEASDKLELVAPKIGQRLVQPFGGKIDQPLNVSLRTNLVSAAEAKAPAMPTPYDGKVIVHGLFRGQTVRADVRLLVHPVATTVVTTHPLPETASIAVRAPRELHAELGTSTGAVAIVLDCTGSMAAHKGQPVESSKWYEAIDALKNMLQKVPRGTQVSIWVFGQAVGAEKTAANPGETIEQLLPPVIWNPADAAKIDDIVASARALEPWNLSPIFRAMYTAAVRDLARASGFKSLVVITDGMDNHFEKDDLLHGGNKDTAAFLLKHFDGIEIHVVGFKLAKQEEEAVKQQFAALGRLNPKGQFHTSEDSRELTFRLQKTLPKKLRYSVVAANAQTTAGALTVGGLEASQSGRDDQWVIGGLAPGGYSLRLAGLKPLTQNVALNRADLLLLELAYDLTGKQVLQRVPYSEVDVPHATFKDRDAWRLSLLQNQRLSERAVQMLVSLEKINETEVGTLQFPKPAKVWLEAAPAQETVASYVSRWSYQSGYPVPAWSLDVPAWPTRDSAAALLRPSVKAWWSTAAPPPAASLEKGADVPSWRLLANKVVRVNDEDVVVESVTVEDHLVEVKPGPRGTPGQLVRAPCLVARVAHSKANPVWVEVHGLETTGSEHRFYGSAGKYTALFWPVTEDQVAKSLDAVNVFSLAAFKREAEQKKHLIEMRNIYEPSPTETRPMQPLKLQETIDPNPAGSAAPVAPPTEILPAPKKLNLEKK